MSEYKRRLPAVAGMFYPDDPRELRRSIERSFADWRFGPGAQPPSKNNGRIYGIISPHAGYAYSGAVAANGYYQISSMDFKTAILVGPNHYGIGAGVATVRDGMWATSLGEVEVNSTWSEDIASRSTMVTFDDFAHSRDHCLEVQLPFLQSIRQEFKIVPVVLIMQDIETALELASAIKESIEEKPDEPCMLVGSSDLTHYEPNEEAHRKDDELIKAILSLDVTRFYSVLERLDVSACGYGAIATVMAAAKELGASRGELLKYATSGDVTGDTAAVVGYSSIVFV